MALNLPERNAPGHKIAIKDGQHVTTSDDPQKTSTTLYKQIYDSHRATSLCIMEVHGRHIEDRE